MESPTRFQHLIVETFTRLGGRLLAVVFLIWLVVLLFNVYLNSMHAGAGAGLVGNRGGAVSEVVNLESSSVRAPDQRLRHDQEYHESRFWNRRSF
jgi:hypothetical protein